MTSWDVLDILQFLVDLLVDVALTWIVGVDFSLRELVDEGALESSAKFVWVWETTVNPPAASVAEFVDDFVGGNVELFNLGSKVAPMSVAIEFCSVSDVDAVWKAGVSKVTINTLCVVEDADVSAPPDTEPCSAWDIVESISMGFADVSTVLVKDLDSLWNDDIVSGKSVIKFVKVGISVSVGFVGMWDVIFPLSETLVWVWDCVILLLAPIGLSFWTCSLCRIVEPEHNT